MQTTGKPRQHHPATPARNKAVWGWAMYDFANSAYTTLIVTFIYAVYFTQQIAPDGITGTALWANGVTITAIAVALLSPVLGALADQSGKRRQYLLATTILCVVSVSLLFFPLPGQVLFALSLFVVSNVAFELSLVLYNAWLPDLARPEQIGRVSGYGWALGYLGGLLAMAVALFGFVLPDQPWFGLSKETGAHIRATTVLVGAWFALFAIPMFIWVPGTSRPYRTPGAGILANTFRQLARTFRDIRQYRQVFRLLVARMIYNDGLVTIFAFGPIYAAETFGFTLTEVMYWGLALNVSAGLGAWLMGFLDDRIGGKKTILLTIIGLFASGTMAVLADSKEMLWLAGLIIGIFVGPNQAASRSLLGRFVPPDKETEFFGFFAFSGKATAFMGPMLLGIVTVAFDSQRAGVAAVLSFFIVGGLLLLTVNEEQGVQSARGG